MSLLFSTTGRNRFASVALAMAMAAGGAHAQSALSWPVMPEPLHLDAFDVGSAMELHQMPVKIRGYVTDWTVSQTAQWYREKMPGQWVQNSIKSKTVLGQKQGDFFITVELEPLLADASNRTTKVITAVMLVAPAPNPNASRTRDPVLERWASRLPTGTRVVSHVVDHESTNSSLHLVAVNRQSVAYNAQHFQDEFRRLGYAINPSFSGQEPANGTALSEKMLFTSGNREAILVLGRRDRGQTTIVLNLLVRKAPS